jgi:hypothetical protein
MPTTPKASKAAEPFTGGSEVEGMDALEEANEQGYLGEPKEDDDDLTVEGVTKDSRK